MRAFPDVRRLRGGIRQSRQPALSCRAQRLSRTAGRASRSGTPPAACSLADARGVDVGAAEAIRRGEIVAVKGVGGFHLMADARNDAAVLRLRARKHRPEKPFAVMFPIARRESERACAVDAAEAALAAEPAAADRRCCRAAAATIARGRRAGQSAASARCCLMRRCITSCCAELGFPVVATSGNLSDEPIVIDEREARRVSPAIADHFLVHDRPILRPLDDSIARVIAGRKQLLRRARGLRAAARCAADAPPGDPRLGGHLKTTVALTVELGHRR